MGCGKKAKNGPMLKFIGAPKPYYLLQLQLQERRGRSSKFDQEKKTLSKIYGKC